ncbi:MAG: thiolase family protein [Desulfurococcales archaeon]|nr:thiolase family protein [Desulfurococcales archaeon]MEB3772749.1 thiolase family protein [Desulfurococcales archaeon]MEB3799175.1 thiolase family protein [Desulfurococcales archaeon]MEB3845599.1 thiolase family protein [Desulfurococcales archaeon]
MAQPYIVDMVRTPVGRFGKSLRNEHPAELASYAARKLVEKTGLSPSEIDFVIMGHVIRAGTSMDTARQVVIRSGFPKEIDGMTVDMVCASGMAALITAHQIIRNGDADVIIAGGVESMSYAPIMLPSNARWGIRHLIGRKAELVDAMVHDGLYDIFEKRVMGEEADLVAKEHGATREELDWIAYESFRRAAEAWDKGYMSEHVVPYEKNGQTILDTDEGIRRDTSLEKLGRLPPAFFPDGLHTAGNSSQLSDGAAVLLVMSEDKMKELGYKPRAKILGYTYTGVETWRFPEAPVYAVKKLLAKLNLTVNDIDYWENNEAFAVSSWLMHHLLGIPYEKLNVHGGAIAIGHPLGMSGARITMELINVLERHGGKRGVASICHGLGGAAALALELA